MVAGKTKQMEKSIVAPVPAGADDQATVFPSLEEFDNAARSDEISKWASLPLDQVFRILAVKEITCRNTSAAGGADRVSRIAKLQDAHGVITSVWLPGTVEKKLLSYPSGELESGCLYIRSLGSKVSKTTGYTYHNCSIFKS